MPAEETGSARSGVSARDAFFHNSVNITEWMKGKVAGAVEGRGYSVVLMRVEAEVMTRMSQVTVINSVTVHFRRGDEQIYALDGYSSVNKDYDGSKNTRWLIDTLKEIEMEAILKFGGKALKTQVDSEYVPKSVDVREAELQKKENLRVEYYFTSTVAEMARILSDNEYIMRWTFGRGITDGASVAFEGITMKDIKVQENAGSTIVAMEYKRDEWKDFSSVSIQLSQIGENVRLILVQKGIPLGTVDILKRHWHERIFMPIVQFFRCPIKEL